MFPTTTLSKDRLLCYPCYYLGSAQNLPQSIIASVFPLKARDQQKWFNGKYTSTNKRIPVLCLVECGVYILLNNHFSK